MRIRTTVALAVLILIISTAGAAPQVPRPSSSAEAGGIKVSTAQGYFVKAKNSNDYACEYSFTYDVVGYNARGDVVSTSEESRTGAVLEAGEQRDLFTAPSDPKRETTYVVKIKGVSNVRKLGWPGTE